MDESPHQGPSWKQDAWILASFSSQWPVRLVILGHTNRVHYRNVNFRAWGKGTKRGGEGGEWPP